MMAAEIAGYFNPLADPQGIDDLRAMQILEQDVHSYMNCLGQQSPFLASAELDKLADDVLNSLDSTEDETVETWATSLAKDFLKFSD